VRKKKSQQGWEREGEHIQLGPQQRKKLTGEGNIALIDMEEGGQPKKSPMGVLVQTLDIKSHRVPGLKRRKGEGRPQTELTVERLRGE